MLGMLLFSLALLALSCVAGTAANIGLLDEAELPASLEEALQKFNIALDAVKAHSSDLKSDEFLSSLAAYSTNFSKAASELHRFFASGASSTLFVDELSKLVEGVKSFSFEHTLDPITQASIKRHLEIAGHSGIIASLLKQLVFTGSFFDRKGRDSFQVFDHRLATFRERYVEYIGKTHYINQLLHAVKICLGALEDTADPSLASERKCVGVLASITLRTLLSDAQNAQLGPARQAFMRKAVEDIPKGSKLFNKVKNIVLSSMGFTVRAIVTNFDVLIAELSEISEFFLKNARGLYEEKGRLIPLLVENPSIQLYLGLSQFETTLTFHKMKAQEFDCVAMARHLCNISRKKHHTGLLASEAVPNAFRLELFRKSLQKNSLTTEPVSPTSNLPNTEAIVVDSVAVETLSEEATTPIMEVETKNASGRKNRSTKKTTCKTQRQPQRKTQITRHALSPNPDPRPVTNTVEKVKEAEVSQIGDEHCRALLSSNLKSKYSSLDSEKLQYEKIEPISSSGLSSIIDSEITAGWTIVKRPTQKSFSEIILAKSTKSLTAEQVLAKYGRFPSECPADPDRQQAPRLVPGKIRIATFNPEWLFLFGGPRGQCPGSGCPWGSVRSAWSHILDVADELRELDADIVSLLEVEDCRILQILIDLLPAEMNYRPYLLRGKDSLGQNIGVLSRVHPSGGFQSLDQLVKTLQTEQDSPSPKGFFAEFSIATPPDAEEIRLTIVGLHLVSDAGIRGSGDAVRQAQASNILNGLHMNAGPIPTNLIVMGDFNESDPSLANGKDLGGNSAIMSLRESGPTYLENAFQFNSQSNKIYTYERRTSEGIVRSAIDHILYSPLVGLQLMSAQVSSAKLREQVRCHHLSDHLPVYADFDVVVPAC